MSKNFELLRRTAKEEGFGRYRSDSLPRDAARARMNREGLAGQEVVKLVQRVFVLPNSHAPRTVVVAGIDESRGSGEICCRMGEVLASEIGGSVCLVEANMRAPSLHQLLGVRKSPGLAEAILTPGRIREFAVQISGGNLWIVPPGAVTTEEQEMLTSDRLRFRITELSDEFDHVLINAPPTASSGEAVLLGQTADGVILILEANCTRRETARRVKETLEAAKITLLGAVLNNRTFPIPEVLYRKL